jgi:hypothetical protein
MCDQLATIRRGIDDLVFDVDWGGAPRRVGGRFPAASPKRLPQSEIQIVAFERDRSRRIIAIRVVAIKVVGARSYYRPVVHGKLEEGVG